MGSSRSFCHFPLHINAPQGHQKVADFPLIGLFRFLGPLLYESYVTQLNDAYDNIFYIYHTVKNEQEIKESKDSKFKLFNASQLAPMVISAGVLDWLFNQVK